MTKHFIKTLLIFAGMISLGLLGVFFVSNYDKEGNANSTASTNNVAK